MQNLSAADRKVVQRQLVQLPPRTKAAQEKEMGDMMGKLKQVGGLIFCSSPCLLVVAWERYIEAIWSFNRELSDGQGREDGRLQHELQPRRPFEWQISTRS